MELGVGETAWLGAVLVFCAAVVAPLVADRVGRIIPVPSTVLEILFGILLGPAVFGWVAQTPLTSLFYQLGLAMLFFLAGYEIDFQRIKGRPLLLSTIAWLLSAVLGILITMAVTWELHSALLIGIAVSTTALGTILPMVRDAGLLPTPMGGYVMAIGAVGEFAPIIMIALLFGGDTDHTLSTDGVLLSLVIIAVGIAAVATRHRSERLHRMLSRTLGTSVQFAVRLSILAVVTLVWVAYELGVDVILGAFAAGIMMRFVISTIEEREEKIVASKLDAIGFGMLVPFFFVVTGIQFDVDALLGSPTAMLLVPVFLVMFLAVRGVVAAWVHRRDLPKSELRPLGLFAATQLPLVIVLAGIGTANSLIGDDVGAAMIGAAMLSVLMFPMLATWGKSKTVDPK